MSILESLQLTGLPLSGFPQIRTRNVAELESAAASVYGELKFGVPRNREGFNAVANHARLKTVGLTCATHGTGLTIKIGHAEFFAQLYALHGSAEVKSRGTTVHVSGDETCVVSPGEPLNLALGPDFGQFVLRVDALALIAKAELLTGDPRCEQLRFDPASDIRRPECGLQRRVLQRLVGLLSAANANGSGLALAEVEQALMISFLFGNRHNLSHLLEQEPPNAAPWQVQRAEAYLQANWAQPVTLEGLARACDASVRSLFHTFRASRDYSPMEFLRRVRLGHAKDMLSDPASNKSVTDVALVCGFANPGHFAKYYRRQFQELPSETVNLARAAVGRARLANVR